MLLPHAKVRQLLLPFDLVTDAGAYSFSVGRIKGGKSCSLLVVSVALKSYGSDIPSSKFVSVSDSYDVSISNRGGDLRIPQVN